MLLLTSTSDTLQVVTSTTDQIDYTWSAVDMTSSPTFVPVSGDGAITTATTTTVVAAPAASTQRQIKHLSLRNVGFTSAPIVVQRNAGTARTMFAATLAVGESLQFVDGVGFAVFDAAGRPRSLTAEGEGYNGRLYPVFKAGTSADTIGYWYCNGKDGGFPGAWAPGAPGINGRTTDGTTAADAGCIPIQSPALGANFLTNVSLTATVAHWFMVFDVLWVNTGLVVTTTGAQAIVTPAFPARCADGTANGEGLMIGLLFTAAATNAAVINNATVSYTNQAGTAGRTATLANLVGAQIPATPVIGTIVWFRLDAGDTGVRSIQSISLGTSLVTGTVSLLVARPLWSQPVLVANVGAHPQPPVNPGVRLYNGTCALVCYQASATTATTMAGTLTVMER